MDQKHEGEIEMPDGEVVTIPRPDKVSPVLGAIDIELAVSVQDGRVAARVSELQTEATLATPHNEIDDPYGYGSLFAGISSIHEDDAYMEMKFDTLDQIRELRDALSLVLRYHGDEPVE